MRLSRKLLALILRPRTLECRATCSSACVRGEVGATVANRALVRAAVDSVECVRHQHRLMKYAVCGMRIHGAAAPPRARPLVDNRVPLALCSTPSWGRRATRHSVTPPLTMLNITCSKEANPQDRNVCPRRRTKVGSLRIVKRHANSSILPSQWWV
jgi:hypothetical protein